MTKLTEMDMTIGKNAKQRSEAQQRVLAKFNNQPPYNQEELLATRPSHFQEQLSNAALTAFRSLKEAAVSVTASLAAVKANWVILNPLRVHCPLCRRRNTVRVLNALEVRGTSTSITRSAAFEYECSYSGCKGYTWSE